MSLDAPLWNHNFHYHDLLLSLMPSPCDAALDVGCGDGTLVGNLSLHSKRAIGIDASREMIERASSAVASRRDLVGSEITLVNDDFHAHDFGGERFDFISCVATIHHMDFRASLQRMKFLLRPGGTLAIVGLAKASTLKDFAFDAAGLVTKRAMRLRRRYFDPEVPIADPRMTYRDVERTGREALPGAIYQRLILFRYLMTWTAQ